MDFINVQELPSPTNKKQTICLNMIVKNEESVIEHTLANLMKHFTFSYWVISDTGSTDNTMKIIETFFEKHNIPGELHQDIWVDFGYNRTRALTHAYNKTDYLLVFDADDSISGNLTFPSPLTHDSYLLTFGSMHGFTYNRPLLINNRIKWRYVGVLHEYLDSFKEPRTHCSVIGNYEITSGRTGSRNNDSQKYLKDAKILGDAYEVEVQNKNEGLADRYAFYCANSYFDYGDYTNAIKWYKITIERNGWEQERYTACLKLYKCYKRLGQIELGQFYLVKSVQFCDTRVDCIYKLVEYYCKLEQYKVAYAYYSLVKPYYEAKFLEEVNAVHLFLDNRVSNFFLPYFMIMVSEKTKHSETMIKMYQIIFLKRTEHIPPLYISCLLHNFQFVIPLLNELKSKIPDFYEHIFSLFNDYIGFIMDKKYEVLTYDFWHIYSQLNLTNINEILQKQRAQKEGPQPIEPIKVIQPFQPIQVANTNTKTHPETPAGPIHKPLQLDVSRISSRASIIESAKRNVDCKNSKNILIFAGFGVIYWNYTYGLNNALGGSERAVNYLASCFPKDYTIYISGNVEEETIGNVNYVRLTNLPALLASKCFHTVIVSRYVAYFDMFPQTKAMQYFIWAHDTALSSYGSNKSETQIIEENNHKIDGLICLTSWHETHMVKQYPLLKGKVHIINNGINPSMFPSSVSKVKSRFVYTSCSERGLERLLSLWPNILKHIPDATLLISSYNAFPSHDLDRKLGPIIQSLSSSVTHCGKLNQSELYNLISSAEYWMYPTSWPETSCITALEMLSAGVLCLYYSFAGLTDTMNNHGIILRENSEIEQLVTLHNMPPHVKRRIIDKGKEYAKSCSWEQRAKMWQTMIERNAQTKMISNAPVKIVNLKHREDRKNKLIALLQREAFTHYQFVEAVNGKELQASNDIQDLFRGNDFNYRKGVVGCALSHIGLWMQLCEDCENEYYVIMEDDVVICNDFKNKLSKVCDEFETNKLEFLYIGRQRLGMQEFSVSDVSTAPFTPEVSAYGLFGYIISKRACKKVLTYLYSTRVTRAIDCVEFFVNSGIPLHTVNKCLVDTPSYQVHHNTDTDIQTNYDSFTFNAPTSNINPRVLKVAFTDWWSQEYCGGVFDQTNNFFVNLLKEKSDLILRKVQFVIPSESPDILFYSMFGNEHKKYLGNKNTRCIYYSGESHPARADADYNFTFDKTDETKSNTRLPLWVCYDNSFLINESNKRMKGEPSESSIGRTKFCSCIISNNGNELRRTIIEKLSQYKQVDCGGNFMNNIGFVVPRGDNCSGKLNHNRQYRFVLAMENTDYPGYCTEKLADAYKSGSLPIYWGNKEVIKDFNPKTFINANDFESVDALVSHIAKVDQDEALFDSYFKEPMLSPFWLDAFNSPNTNTFFKDCFNQMVGISNTSLTLHKKCIERIDKISAFRSMKGKRTAICGVPQFNSNIINEYMGAIKELGYDIQYCWDYHSFLRINPDVVFIICYSVPKEILNYCETNNIVKYILNLEQLTRWNNKKSLLDGYYRIDPVAVLDYSNANIHILNELGLTNEWVPNLYNPYDIHQLTMLRNAHKFENTELYDFGIITRYQNMSCSERRKNVVDHLRKNGFTVNVINGWLHHRDNELAKCKVILNIHSFAEYNTFEHLRCDRLLNAGYNVLTEDCSQLDEELIQQYDNLKVVQYETLMSLQSTCEWDDFKSIYSYKDPTKCAPVSSYRPSGKLEIYNVWHNKLFDDMYQELAPESLKQIIMYGVNVSIPKEYNRNRGYNILYEYDLPDYNESLQRNGYCQTSAFYHVHKHALHANAKYVGFIQYDMRVGKNALEDIERRLDKNPNTMFYHLIKDAQYMFKEDFGSYGLCAPYNNSVLEQYNKYFNTNYVLEDLLRYNSTCKVILLHTFVIPKEMFDKMMAWFIHIFDWLHKNVENKYYKSDRASFTEKMFALFLYIEQMQNESIQLMEMDVHHVWPLLHNQTIWEHYKER